MSYTLAMLGPINVADYRDWLRPGVWRDDLPRGLGGTPVNLLCRELLSRGHKLTILTLDPTVKGEVVLEGDGLRICVGPIGPAPARSLFKAERNYLLNAIRRERPDVLHAQWTYEYALAAQASGLPHVITAHDAPITVLRYNFIKYRMARTLMAYRCLARARNVVAVSPHVARHIRRFMLYHGKGRVIPNGLPEEFFSRQRTDRPAERVTFGTVLNGWSAFKNAHVAIEAFSRYRRRRPGDRLVMFGTDFGPGERAASWATEHGAAEGIEFAGEIPHAALIERLAREVDVLVHPSLEEAHPMGVIEAMALSIPVIGGRRSGGVPWTLDEGRAGVLVDVASPAAIEAAMLQLADERERLEWGRRGKEHAARTFHIRTVADAYESLYAEVLGARARVAAEGLV
jgi:L-malate glycosyltransferase